MVPPADGVYLRERHPHRLPGRRGSHPLHVSAETNPLIFCHFLRSSSGSFSKQLNPLQFLKIDKCQILLAQDLAHHSEEQAAFLL